MRALHLIGLVLAVSTCFAADPVLDISNAAIAALQVPGSADFLVADGDDVWITNQGRVEQLRRGEPRPIATVRMPQPAGAMAIGFGSLWVASGGTNQSLHRINRDTARVEAVIPTGLADLGGELSVAVGAGSVWLLTDAKGEVSSIDPARNAA
jgi:virginiamycin B lyase